MASPSSSRRGPLWAVLLVAAVLGGLFVLDDRGGDGAEAGSDRSTPPPAREAQPVGRRPTTTTTAAAPLRPADGPLLPGQETGTVLVVSRGQAIVSVDVDTGRIEEQVWTEGPGRADWAVAAGSHAVLVGGGKAWSLLPFSGQSPVELGPASQILPSSNPGRVWLVVPTGLSATVREVAFDGTVTFPPLSLPSDVWPLAGVEGGLLVDAYGVLAVLDPVTGAARSLLPGRFVSTNGTTISVLTCRDGLDCGLRLVDVRTGVARDVPTIPGTQGYTQVTSLSQSGPGSGGLLVGVRVADGSTGMAPPLAAVDLATGTGRVIFLGDIGQPLAVDPSVRWAFAGGRGGLQGGSLGQPLRTLPINLQLGANPLLVALTANVR